MAKSKRGKETSGPAADQTTDEGQRDRFAFWLSIAGTFVGTALGVAAIVAPIVQYHEQKLYEVKSATLEQEKRKEIADTKATYETRLRSLQFGLGSREEYFDVSKLLIAPAQVYSLPATARRFELDAHLTFFVADYPGGDWRFERSNEFALTEAMVGREQTLREQNEMGVDLAQSPVYLFRAPEEFVLNLRDRRRNGEAAPRVTFFPVVVVQPIEHAKVADMLGIAQKERMIAQLLAQRPSGRSPLMAGDVETRIAAALGDMYRSDFAGQVLNSVVDQGFDYVSDYDDVEYGILRLQKLENIVFLQTVLTFNRPTGRGDNDPPLQVHELVFFVNGPYRSFFIRALVPAIAGKESPGFDWVRRWLTGVRLVWRSSSA